MNAQRFRIVAASTVILLLIGIGAFLAYDMNAPIQQVRVYDMPDKSTRRPVADMEEAPAPYVKKQETILSNNTDIDWIHPETDDGCCPDDPALAILGHSEVYDLNPVSPEVFADMQRIREWHKAYNAHYQKSEAHDTKVEALHREMLSVTTDFFASLSPEARDKVVAAFDEQLLDADKDVRQPVLEMIYGAGTPSRTNEEIIDDAESLVSRIKSVHTESKALAQEKPVYPTLTHEH